ncbi:MAG: translocation/assembly module TamB domain-containing protein [bacterium]|nr:translocation/assembly module TamB domain-containing protein [bacterium]
MWRQHLRHSGRVLLRTLLWGLLLLVLLLLPLLAILGSETGSRWVLERGLGMQSLLTWDYQSGTLLGGLELREVHVRTAKLDVHVRHVLARWSLLQLLRGDIELEKLKAEGVALKMLAPPTGKPTKLPLLILPVRLHIRTLEIQGASLLNWQASAPLTLDRVILSGQWWGSKVRVDSLLADQGQIGRLRLRGIIRLRGGYPLDLKGSLAYKPFLAQGWQPVLVHLTQSVAELALQLDSSGPLTASASGHIQPLQPSLPYSATLKWQPVELPWWKEQALASQGGTLRVTGDKTGLRSQGEAQLQGRQLPSGQYAWKGRTNWKSADVESFNFNGLGGDLQAKGNVSWGSGLAWSLSSRFRQLDLARHWPVPHSAVPVLSGKLESKGHTSYADSAMTASVRLAQGESWEVQEKGRSWLWNLQSPQYVSLQWAGVQRQMPGLESLASDSGRLVFKGALPDYQLTLDAGLQSPRLPAGRWTAGLSGQNRHMDVDHLDYLGEAGTLSFGGELELGASVQWQGALVLGDFSTAWLSRDWSGQFSGHISGRGIWGADGREAHLEDSHLTGVLRDQPVIVDGALDLRLPEHGWPEVWTTTGFGASWGVNHVLAKGGLQKRQWNLAADVQLGDVSLLDDRLKGAVRGRVALQGDEVRPDVQADLQGTGVGSKAFYARTATVTMRLQELGESASSMLLQADGLTNPSGADYGHVQLDMSGSRSAHTLRWQAGNETIKGAGSFAGGLDAGTLNWQGRMESGEVSLADMQWRLAAPYAVDWTMADRQLQLAAHCWMSAEASFCNEAPMLLGPTGRLQLSLKGLQAERLQALLPEGLGLSGQIAGLANGGWQPGQHPVLKAEVYADNGIVSLARDEPSPPLQVTYQRIALGVEAVADKLHLQFDLASTDMGQGKAEATVDPYVDDKTLQGTVSLQGLRLDILKPFWPALETLAGTVSADGRLEGTLALPRFWGTVLLADGELGVQGLPVNINSINTRVEVKGTAADITGSMRSGEGTAALNGQADWAGTPRLDMTLKGERFELRRLPELLAEISPDLRLQVVPGQADITGTIRVPMGRLNLKSLATKAVPLSSDVTLVSAGSGTADRVRLSRAMSGWVINADINVLLGDDVFFHGYGVNGRLMGGLRLRQQGRKGLEANGEVELDKDSRYDAYGQRLLIRRGRLIFAGNLTQPGLDVEAVREIDNKVVGVRVEGRANAPEATLFSDSSMSQEEIISYLVLGRPLDTSGKPESGQNLSAAAAAIKLGATGGAGLGLTDKLGGTLGITDLAVDAEGTGEDTQFTVSGYISPRLYLRYGVGIFTPVNTATIRYKISAKLYLEAVSSLENAIDLFYNWRF